MASDADLGVVRAMLADLRDSLAADPALRARTADFLAADLELETLEALMAARDTPIRLPDELIARAEALVEPMTTRRDLLAWNSPNRTAILRLALGRGLDSLEAEVLGKGGNDE
jgi:hypothetical protein